MNTWPERRLRDEMTALKALWKKARACHRCLAADAWERMPVRAALMLHSDCAQRARRDGQSPQLQESAAVEVASLMKDDPSHRAFARRWYEAMASLAQGENRWAEALDWAERGLRDFPDSVEMLLVLGSIEETLGAQAASPRNRRGPRRSQHAGGAGPSCSSVARSAGTSRTPSAPCARRSPPTPSLLEPRLRLGRVAWRLGETAEARSALQDVLAREAGRRDGVPRPPVPRPARRGRRPARRRRARPTRPRSRSTRAPSRRGSPSATCACGAETQRAPARRSRRRSARRAAARSRTRSGSIPGDPPSGWKTGSRRCAGRLRRERPRARARRGRVRPGAAAPHLHGGRRRRVRGRLRDRRQPPRRRPRRRRTSS